MDELPSQREPTPQTEVPSSQQQPEAPAQVPQQKPEQFMHVMLYTTIFVIFLAVVFAFAKGSYQKTQLHLQDLKTELVEQQVFERSTANLPQAQQTQVIDVKNKAAISLDVSPVAKTINGKAIRMYAYNSQIPGPLFKVKQGSTFTVNVKNNLDTDTTIHWHGIRLANKDDGVEGITQEPIKPGETYTYTVTVPDPGMYWYHPHMREDMQQELGLYGNIFVEAGNKLNGADKEVILILDDIKILDNDVYPFKKEANHALMGRFGNVLLVNGEPNYKLDVQQNSIVRFYVTNAASTRPFKVSIEGHKLKLIGSDAGKYERETLADNVILAPGERAVFEVLLDKPGIFKIFHATPANVYTLGAVTVTEAVVLKSKSLQPRTNEEIIQEMEPFKRHVTAPPDYDFELTVQSTASMQHEGHAASRQPIEWEDDMEEMNEAATSKNTKWIIRDRKTGRENMDINYDIKVNDIKKIRLFNNPNSAHPMQHPMHLHGQRFLVLAENNKPNDNLVWKDTALVPSGSTVDILVHFTNPGKWVFHCHISEHLEAGMMSLFTVS